MLKLLIYSLILLLSYNSFSQNTIVLPDSNLTVYDVYYLQNLVDNQTDIVTNLNVELNSLQYKYMKLNNDLSKVQYSLNLYKNIFSSLLISIYKIKSTSFSTFIFLFSSNSFNQIYKRFNYFKLLTKYLTNLTQYINLLNKQLNLSLLSLEASKELLNTCLVNYQNSKNVLDSNTNILLQQSYLMQQNAATLRIKINRDYSQYDSLIFRIMNANLANSNDTLSDFVLTLSPLNNCVVISSFGVHNHPYFKGVSVKNDGIDLFSSTDTIVKAVLDGTVVAVIKIPNYGYSIVIQHNNYYTVYSNLNFVYVSNNSLVYKSQILGSLSKKTSKYSFPCLNFQIWKGQQKLNPKIFYDF
ncbi:MAG: M23 family metallopeptidase [Bacteroidales bacterium]|nr:M23 family metallopeptidase [Bacteroidales bacterium]